jgi:hypothetical protein
MNAIPVQCAHHAIVSIHELKPNLAEPSRCPERQLVFHSEAIRRHGWRAALTVSGRSDFIVDATVASKRPAGSRRTRSRSNTTTASCDEELADLLAHKSPRRRLYDRW